MKDFSKYYPSVKKEKPEQENPQLGVFSTDPEMNGLEMTLEQLKTNCCGHTPDGERIIDQHQKILEELIEETLSQYPKGLHNIIRRKYLESISKEV